MRQRGSGRILVTGSIAGYMPGTYSAVYNGSKAFLDAFAAALRSELQDSGVTVTCLMPGATDTPFFERAGLQDTKLATQKKDDPAMVARLGYDAMAAGEPRVVTGLRNKLQLAAATVTPSRLLAAAHRMLAEPGSAGRRGAETKRSPTPEVADTSPATPAAAAESPESAEPKRRGSRPARATKSSTRSRVSSGRTPADPGRP
jgi:NAD(P)-dependent dehydrogenase (short-subunit alcohol dehydrogenase family)